jgi:tetratricopeptide (TPR) repeat protein
MRPKTKRRLLILLVSLVIVIGGAVTLVVMTTARKARAAQSARETGMTAFAKGDYDTALKQLSAYNAYLDKKDDADAIYAQAVSRSMVVAPQKQHIKTAIDWLEHYTDLRPNDLKAYHKLLDLYTQLGRTRETIDTTDDILKIDPNDVVALRTKATTLQGQRKFKEAVAVSEKMNEVAPLDLDGQRLTYSLYAQLKRPGSEVVARAKADLAKHPDDPRMELLLAIAYGYAGENESARKMLTQAASRKAPDADFIRNATLLLDADKAFDVSRAMLTRAAADLNSPDVLQLLVQRLWQDGDIAEMGKHLAKVDANDPNVPSNLLAMKAISLYDAGDKAAGKAVVDALTKRASDDDAFGWSTAINAYYGGEKDPRDAITALQSAANRDRDNAVIYLWMGDAYEQLGEVDLAIGAWKTAANMSPAWATPYVRMAKLLATSGRANEAYNAAQQAGQRAPKALETRVAGALALSAKLADDSQALSGAGLLRMVDEIQHDAANEPQTLPMYVTLLARSGQQEKAVAVIKGAIAPQANVPQATLLKLADVSGQLKLGQEQAILDAATKLGSSPALALAVARQKQAAGQGEEAIAALRTAVTAGTADPAGWQLALQQFLDQTRPTPDAAGWKTLVEKYAADLRVQMAYLQSPVRGVDRAVWASTVDRLKSLSREEGARWRLERARFLLSGEPSERDRADATTLVNELLRINPEMAEARMMSATIHLKAGNRAQAIDQLKKAVELRPGDSQTLLTLARLLQEQGQSIESQSYLSRIVAAGELSPADTQLVAQMFADQGETTKAINLLRSLNTPDPAVQLQLAQLYRRDGRTKEAGDLFTFITAAKTPSPEAVAAAADFYFENGNAERANRVLARLDELKGSIPPGRADLIRGQLAEKYDSTDVAQKYLMAAVAASSDAESNKALAGFYLRRNDLDKARTAVIAGLAAKKDDAELLAILKGLDGLAKVPAEHRANLAASVSLSPSDPAITELLKVLAGPADKQLDSLKLLGNRYSRSWPVMEQLALAYQASGSMDKARDAATRGMNAAPRDPAPARLVYQLASKTEQWSVARSAAEQWKQRAPNDARAADVAMATADLAMNRDDQVVATLKPYTDAARKDVRGWLDVLWPYCRAQLRLGHVDEVTGILLEPAKGNAGVRNVWLAMAPDVRPSALAATAWINQVAEQVSTDNKEQATLAWAWYAVGQKYDDTASFARSAAIFRELIKRGESTLNNWVMVADALRGSNDVAGAEAAYRKAIEAGDSGYSCNALAYMLLLQDKPLDEALGFASRAIAAAPRSAQYYDTRGQIYLKLNKPQPALEDFERALAIDGGVVESSIGKADALAKLGKLDQSRLVLQQVDNILANRPLVSRYTREQLASVRQATAK